MLSRLWLVLAAGPALAQTEIAELHGENAGDQFGWSTVFVGDVDGDGFADLAVGAPFHDAAGPDSGRVSVYSGRTTELLHTWDGLAGDKYFGFSIAGVGDLDGDDLADVLVGTGVIEASFGPYKPITAGYAQLISGGSGAVLHTFTAPAGVVRFGYALAGGPDLDGDGVGELLIGAPGDQHPGYVYVYSGATYAKIRRDGQTGVRNFGAAVAFLDDVNGDGVKDYAVGAPYLCNCPNPGFGKGFVFLIDGAGGTLLWSQSGNSFDDQFGYSLARIGDLDADGTAELLVGMRDKGGFWIACQCGAQIQLLSGASGAVIRVHDDLNCCGAYGTAVAGLGDLDGDGLEEYVGGEPGWEPAIDPNMRLRVFAGADGALVAKLEPPGGIFSSIGWGFALAAGDANGDGLQDFAIGAPWEDTAGADAGMVSLQTIVRGVNVYCQAQVNSQGCTPMIGGAGTPSTTMTTPFLIEAGMVINQKTGLLFYGYAPKATPFLGGTKCIQVPLKRTSLLGSGGNPAPPEDCSGVLSYDFNARIQSGVDPGLVAGAEVFAQFWSRDPQSASTMNLTDALAFQIAP